MRERPARADVPPGPDFTPQRPLVLYVGATRLGGAEIYLKRLALELSRRGVPQVLVCSDRPVFDLFAAEVAAGGTRVVRAPLRSSFDYRPFYTVVPLLDAAQIRLHRRLFATLTPGLVLNNQGRRTDGQPALLAARLWGDFPFVSMLHFHFPLTMTTRYVGRLHGLATKALYRVLREDVVILTSRIGAERAPANLGIDPARIRAVHAGIDPRMYRPARRAAGRPPRILLVGRLDDHHKGQADAIKALPAILRAVPDAELVLAGDGRDRERLAALARELGVQARVTFLGWIDDIPAVLQGADMLLVPSPHDELPQTVLEGFAARLPVIATATGGIPEMAIDGRTGLTIPPRAPGALAAAVVRVLTEPGLRERLVEGAHRWLLEEFTVDAFADGVLGVLAEAQALHAAGR